MNDNSNNMVGKIITNAVDSSFYHDEAGILAKFIIRQPRCTAFHYIIQRGSVQSFSPSGFRYSAIVIESNEYCTTTGGAIRAIINSGGERLLNDIEKLPTIGRDAYQGKPSKLDQVSMEILKFHTLSLPWHLNQVVRAVMTGLTP
jgi:hypothetical protein